MQKHLGPAGRRGFTVIEVLISVVLGAGILGVGMYLYLQGNRSFYKTTEHVSFRAEAILCLEHVARDLEQLMVSPDKLPGTNTFSLLQPYELLGTYDLQVTNPETKAKETIKASKGIRFYRHHHVEMGPAEPGIDNGKPYMVGRWVEYKVEPVDSADETKGVNLLRNGKPVNNHPLRYIQFQQEPAIVAYNQVKGSQHAIVTVTIVPRGGAWGQMREEVMERLRTDGSIVSRTFHLTAYESMYTTVLYAALEKMSAAKIKLGGSAMPSPGAVLQDELERTIYEDAYANAPPQLLANIAKGVGKNASYAYDIPRLFKLEDKQFTEEGAGTDGFFMSQPAQTGAPPAPLNPAPGATGPTGASGPTGPAGPTGPPPGACKPGDPNCQHITQFGYCPCQTACGCTTMCKG